MTPLAPDLFAFVVNYAEELSQRDELLTELDPDQGLVLFSREFFNQFFGDVFGVQVQSFSASAAVDVWIAVQDHVADDSPETRIVAAFREFCQDYDTIVGEHYDRGGELSNFQREFVPTLLTEIAAWAADNDREDMLAAAEEAQESLRHALEGIGANS